MTNSPFEKLLENGNKVVADSYVLIQPTPHVAPAAYFHVIYSSLNESEISEIESLIQRQIPGDLVEFYKIHNGCQLFSGALSVDGLRRNTSRTVDASRQPFSMVTPNIDERIKNSPTNAVFFGGYDWDGSLLYCMPNAKEIFRCNRDSAEPINQWPSLDDFFSSEIERLSKLFTGDGRQIDEDRPTTPD
ncbi:SMI1/KNR4 family protein [uncultured Zoogloea sp.]|uniref:SMI1/KNR4 family protein n=1 Tax=uncultured Zoogloea sp. TaxID=160237 RepID=UPI0026367731|nr:SMI1/KNR4 family protein [uncultured Zoogloea sp.]